MKKLKWRSPVTGIIIVTVLLAGYFFYQKQTYTPQPSSQETTQPSSSGLDSPTINDENEVTNTQVEKITLLPTTGWKEVSLEGVSFQIPSEGRFETGKYGLVEEMGFIYFSDLDVIPSKVEVQNYTGGSRREQFLSGFENKERIIEDCKLKFEEALFGKVRALQISHSDSSCPSGIVAVAGDKLVILHDLYYNSATNQITRTPEIDTVISTLH